MSIDMHFNPHCEKSRAVARQLRCDILGRRLLANTTPRATTKPSPATERQERRQGHVAADGSLQDWSRPSPEGVQYNKIHAPLRYSVENILRID